MSIKRVSALPEKLSGLGGRKHGRITRDIIEFMDSDMQICELSTDGYKNVSTVESSAHRSAAMLGRHVTVCRRNNRVFLVKNEESR